MKKRNISILLGILTFTLPNFTYFGMLFYFRQLATSQIMSWTTRNPFYLGFFLLNFLFLGYMLLKTKKSIICYYNKEACEEELLRLQKKIVKFPTIVLVFCMVYSLASPQFLLLGHGMPGSLRLDLTLLSLANLLLVGMPSYIFFIRTFEDYCSGIPFSTEFLSMKLSIRTLLVTMFSLVALTILVYLAIKVSGMGQGLVIQEVKGIMAMAAPLVFFAVVLTSTCIYLLMAGINKRILLSRHLVQRLAQRDYSGGPSPIPSRDELGHLIHELNQVKHSTGELLNEIRVQAETTIETKQNLVTVAEESSSAMTEMTSNIQSVGNSITNLDNNINEVTGSMERLRQFIKSLSGSMDQQVQSQEESTAAIEEMTASIENMAQITGSKIHSSKELEQVSEQGEAILKTTIEQIGKIFESLDDIKNMTKLILNIAAQTNMLAMNAAIEAAHAGDAGRGFSVVADEIRKLAETASVNSKQINESIKDIVGLVESATQSGGKTTQAFNSISTGIQEMLNSLNEISTGMGELKTGGQQILGSVETIRRSSDELNRRSSQMNQETDKVNQAAAGLTQISAEARIAMDEMGIGAQEVLNSSLSLNDQASELDETSGKLKKWIDEFHMG